MKEIIYNNFADQFDIYIKVILLNNNQKVLGVVTCY